MKSKAYLLLIAMVGLCLQFSCKKFLTKDPQTALTQQQVYSSLQTIEPLIIGLYTSWRNVHKDRGGFMFELGSDEAQQGAFQVATTPDQAALDKYDGSLIASNNALTQQWDSRWPTVASAAKAIYALQHLKAGTGNEERRKELLGEACFIWSAVSFTLTQYWGAIPIIDASPEKTAAFGTARQPVDSVYSYLVRYLEYASENLPETQSDKGRATKYAALSLLGKVYMYAPKGSAFQDFKKAADCFEKVISSGKYHLVDNYDSLFSAYNANSSESIYEFQFNNTYPDNNQIQWQMGTRVLAVLYPNCFFGGYDLMVPTKYCYSNKAQGGVWETGDTRKNASIRYGFTYHGTVPKLLSGFGGDELDPHVKKYEDKRTDDKLSFWYSGKDVFYLRYADILLCDAECLNELGQTSKAVGIVNDQIRNRAWGGHLPDSERWNQGLSKEQFLTDWMDERMREMCFEGWRRMDLIYSGKFSAYIKARNKWAQSGNVQSYYELYPIPLTEILQNPDMSEKDQNPGYSN
jgi:hypothetical protein